MKTILLAISVCCIFSFNSFSQKITYRDLIGTSWAGINDRGIFSSPYMKFIDSTTIRFENNGETQSYEYQLDTTCNPTILLLIEYIPVAAKSPSKYITRQMIKIESSTTLKLQLIKKYEKGKQWNNNEPVKYTYTYHKLN